MTERDWHRANANEAADLLCALNLQAILDHYGATNVEELGRELYKSTDCGPVLSVQLHDGRWKHTGDLASVKTGHVRGLQVGSIVEGSDAHIAGAVTNLLTEGAYADLIAAFDREVRLVDARAMNALAVQTLHVLATENTPTDAPTDALGILAELVDQLDGIGIPEWHGAEGLSLEAARAAIANRPTTAGASATTPSDEPLRLFEVELHATGN